MKKVFGRNVILGIGLILVSIIVFFVASNILVGQMEALSADISASRAFIARRAELLSNLANIKNLAPDTDLYRKKINELLPTRDRLLRLPQAMADIAYSRNVTLTFTFGGSQIPPQENFPGVANFSLMANGSFKDLLLFLGDIEPGAIQFLIGVENLDFAMASAGNYNMSLGGRAFFQ